MMNRGLSSHRSHVRSPPSTERTRPILPESKKACHLFCISATAIALFPSSKLKFWQYIPFLLVLTYVWLGPCYFTCLYTSLITDQCMLLPDWWEASLAKSQSINLLKLQLLLASVTILNEIKQSFFYWMENIGINI